MKKALFALMVCVPVFMSQWSFAEPLKAKHSVELKDVTGDVQTQDGQPGKDVVKVSIKSDGKSLHVTAVLKENASHYLKRMAGHVITLHFDTDNNPKTGGKLFWSKKSGFEY